MEKSAVEQIKERMMMLKEKKYATEDYVKFELEKARQHGVAIKRIKETGKAAIYDIEAPKHKPQIIKEVLDKMGEENLYVRNEEEAAKRQNKEEELKDKPDELKKRKDK